MNNLIYWDTDRSLVTSEWKCPFCNIGLLELRKENLIIKEYESSIINHPNPDIEGSWIEKTCAGIFICNNKSCKEKVSFCGSVIGEDYEYCENNDLSQTSQSYHDVITPLLLFPSPHLIKISDKFPKIIVEHLKESFNLYWLDKMSCANKLRIVVEDVLNYKKIKKTEVTKKAKKWQLTTHQRIILFQKIPKYKEAGSYLLAIKWIGNIGSHPGFYNEEMIIKGYELIEKALDIIFIKSEETLIKTRNRIIKSKGRIFTKQ